MGNENAYLALELGPYREPLDPATLLVEQGTPLNISTTLTSITLELATRSGYQPWQCEPPNEYDEFLDMTQSLQKVFLPAAGRFPSDADEVLVDRRTGTTIFLSGHSGALVALSCIPSCILSDAHP